MSSIKAFFDSFIPKRISNRVVVNFVRTARVLGKPSKKSIADSLNTNFLNISNHEAAIVKAGGYIEDQENYTDMKYGNKTMQWSGCGVMATYNALVNLKSKKYPAFVSLIPELIRYYEMHGIVFKGALGTSPLAIAKFFKEKGFDVTVCLKEKDFDKVGETSDTLILAQYNDRDNINKGVHFIQISKDNGKFRPHNVNCDGSIEEERDSVTEVIKNINKGKAKGFCLIGISAPKKV